MFHKTIPILSRIIINILIIPYIFHFLIKKNADHHPVNGFHDPLMVTIYSLEKTCTVWKKLLASVELSCSHKNCLLSMRQLEPWVGEGGWAGHAFCLVVLTLSPPLLVWQMEKCPAALSWCLTLSCWSSWPVCLRGTCSYGMVRCHPTSLKKSTRMVMEKSSLKR